MLFMTYPSLVPTIYQSDAEDPNIAPPDYEIYIPRVFGFRVSELSVTGPRMRWLRWKEGLPEEVVFGDVNNGRASRAASGGTTGTRTPLGDGLKEEQLSESEEEDVVQ